MNGTQSCGLSKMGDKAEFDNEVKNVCLMATDSSENGENGMATPHIPNSTDTDGVSSLNVTCVVQHVGDGDTNQQVIEENMKENVIVFTSINDNDIDIDVKSTKIEKECVTESDCREYEVTDCQLGDRESAFSDTENETLKEVEELLNDANVETEKLPVIDLSNLLENNETSAKLSVQHENDESSEICSTNNKRNDSVLESSSKTEDTLANLQPIHQQLQTEMISLQWKCKQQAEQLSQLRRENQRLSEELADKVETPPEIYEVQMEALEKTISNLQRENSTLQEKLVNHDEVAKKTITSLKVDLGSKLDKMTNMYETANREKELMVIKYAHGEKDILTLKKIQEDMEKKLRDCAKERESLHTKLKNLNLERTRICQAFDKKTADANSLQRENEKLKEQLSSKDIKIKWAQNKLRTEMDAHKETETKLERLQQKLKETREEAEQIRKDCQEMIRTYQDSEDVRSNSLDLQLKEKETELKAKQQEKSNQEEVYHSVIQELDILKKKQKFSVEENNNLIIKIQSLEGERLEYENNLSRLKDSLNSYRQEIVDLTAKLAEMENLKLMVDREKEKAIVSHNEIERIRQANAELLMDMDACRAKEGELLEFTERLTSKNVTLQSEYAILENKTQMYESEQNRLVKLTADLEKQIGTLKSQLDEEKQIRQRETQLLARKLAEKTKTVDNLNLKLDEEMNENRVLKRRHAASVKELTREIQLLKRKIETSESAQQSQCHLDGTSGLGSRVSSTGSLDNTGCSVFNNPTLTSNINNNGSTKGPTHNGPILQDNVITVEPSRQLLIERIVKLQKSLARKNEKIEFLDEHVRQLITELRKKSRIIQSYVVKLEPGALATEKMDQNKFSRRNKSKIDLSRRGGIMASVYSSQPTDDAMTFELSLEINQKLQAVLEDTLLKNITLKENINTLGNEIARLLAKQESTA